MRKTVCGKAPRLVLSFAALTALGGASARAQHASDFWIGERGGALATSPRGVQPDLAYFHLPRVDEGFLIGWTDNDPGFDHVLNADPANSIFPLFSGAQVWIQIVSMDPALILIDDAFNILELPGDRSHLGNHLLHEHFTWFIEEENPGFDPGQCVWRATFLFDDKGSTNYANSAPITVEFTNIPLREADGDFEPDGDVDAEDAAALPECLQGPGRRPEPGDATITTCEVDCVNAFDFDGDRDVDLRDVAALQSAFTGSR